MGKEKIFSLLAIVLVLAASVSALTQKEEEILESLMKRADSPAEKQKIADLVEEKNIVFNDPDTRHKYEAIRLEIASTAEHYRIDEAVDSTDSNKSAIVGFGLFVVLLVIAILMIIYLKIKKKTKNLQRKP